MQNSRVLIVGFGLLLLAGSRAHATPVIDFYSSAAAGVTNHNTGGTQDSDNILANFSDTVGPATASLAGGSAFASVIDGTLHAFATTTSFGFSSNGSAQFFDTLFLTSATLPAGTPVFLFEELVFTATVTPNGVSGPCSGNVAYGGLDAANSQGSAGSLFVQDHTCDSLDINNATGLLQGFIGQELTVNAFLNAGTGAFTLGTADASNALKFYLTPLGDFTYSTASGNSYINDAQVEPVPEPTSLLLVGSGLSLAVSRLRARRRPIVL